MKDILVVEDGKQERERLEKLFQSEGYSVIAAQSVAEAEKALEREHYRLAILDIGLGDKSGSYLFNDIKRRTKAPYIIIFTGNPSVHLKQRFMAEGAVDYIVKGSAQASNDQVLGRVRDLIGKATKRGPEGIDLERFIEQYLSESSRKLFLSEDNTIPVCSSCGAQRYVVTFSHKPQLPPEVIGQVVCASCSAVMDPTLG